MCQYGKECLEVSAKELLCQSGKCIRNELSCDRYRENRQLARSSSIVRSQMTISFFSSAIKPITAFA